jgi:prefoldin subunit 5
MSELPSVETIMEAHGSAFWGGKVAASGNLVMNVKLPLRSKGESAEDYSTRCADFAENLKAEMAESYSGVQIGLQEKTTYSVWVNQSSSTAATELRKENEDLRSQMAELRAMVKAMTQSNGDIENLGNNADEVVPF